MSWLILNVKVQCISFDNLVHRPMERSIVAAGKELRVLSLGDSITFGLKSTAGNGYRQPLQKKMAGSDLNFIGSVHFGTMQDNANEGYPGAVIDEIADHVRESKSLSEQPNLVLLMAGTNDLFYNPPPQPREEATQRLDSLIDECLAASPKAVILVAQLIVCGDPEVEARHVPFNEQVADITEARAARGQHVMAVDFSSIQTDDLDDGVHPTDEGYRKMGDIWFDAIKEADRRGWIQDTRVWAVAILQSAALRIEEWWVSSGRL